MISYDHSDDSVDDISFEETDRRSISLGRGKQISKNVVSGKSLGRGSSLSRVKQQEPERDPYSFTFDEPILKKDKFNFNALDTGRTVSALGRAPRSGYLEPHKRIPAAEPSLYRKSDGPTFNEPETLDDFLNEDDSMKSDNNAVRTRSKPCPSQPSESSQPSQEQSQLLRPSQLSPESSPRISSAPDTETDEASGLSVPETERSPTVKHCASNEVGIEAESSHERSPTVRHCASNEVGIEAESSHDSDVPTYFGRVTPFQKDLLPTEPMDSSPGQFGKVATFQPDLLPSFCEDSPNERSAVQKDSPPRPPAFVQLNVRPPPKDRDDLRGDPTSARSLMSNNETRFGLKSQNSSMQLSVTYADDFDSESGREHSPTPTPKRSHRTTPIHKRHRASPRMVHTQKHMVDIGIQAAVPVDMGVQCDDLPFPAQTYGSFSSCASTQVPYTQVPYTQAPYAQAPYAQAPHAQAPHTQAPMFPQAYPPMFPSMNPYTMPMPAWGAYPVPQSDPFGMLRSQIFRNAAMDPMLYPRKDTFFRESEPPQDIPERGFMSSMSIVNDAFRDQLLHLRSHAEQNRLRLETLMELELSEKRAWAERKGSLDVGKMRSCESPIPAE